MSKNDLNDGGDGASAFFKSPEQLKQMMAMSGGKRPRYGDKIDTIELDPKT